MSTTIQWCDEVWNPVIGCSRVSSGCDNCYAMGQAHRGMAAQHRGLTKVRAKDSARPGVDWTGDVRLVPTMLDRPLRWRKPSRVFVNSMSDLFHAQVPFEYIAAVFGVMAACPQHTFLVLTKRPSIAREFFAWLEAFNAKRGESGRYGTVLAAQNQVGDAYTVRDVKWRGTWPLPNVHLGVSVEDQTTADARIPILLELPAALRWVSYEPALGPVLFDRDRGWLCDGIDDRGGPHLDWIVIGGESGARARPFDTAWAAALIDARKGTGCCVFVKQLGSYAVVNRWKRGGCSSCSEYAAVVTLDRSGGDPDEWPAHLRVREYPMNR